MSSSADPISVLVVDDDFRVAELHADYVSRMDDFAVAGTARSCTETARRLAGSCEQQPDTETSNAPIRPAAGADIDLVLLDSYLPDGSGIEFLGSPAIREAKTDVIMVTADNAGRSIRRAIQLGAVNYLVKPFEYSRLADLLHAYRNYCALLAREHCDQTRVDEALRTLREGNRTTAVKGQSPITTQRIGDLFTRTQHDLSALDVANHIGIARATAQRYLSQMAEDGVVDVFLKYGTTGRPEHRYRVRGPQGMS